MRVGAWLLDRFDSPYLLIGLYYVAKHSINGACEAISLRGTQPMELNTDVTGAYVSESAEVLHFL